MDKKLFIKNRPFDINDANDMLNWTEAGIQNVIKSLYSYGIMSGMAVANTSGLGLSISTGTAFDSNYSFINVKSTQNITLSAADPSNPRYDKIVISYNTSITNNVDTTNAYGLGTSLVYSQNKYDSYTIQVIKGTAAVSPVVPATPAGALDLAQVLVGAGATSLTAGNITDLRSFARASNTNMLAASTTQAGTVQLSDSISDTSTTKASTANSVKLLADWVKSFGLGDIAKDIGATSANNIDATGYYYAGTTATDQPIAAMGFYILNVKYSSTSAYQMAFHTGSSRTFIRRKSTAWDSWVELAQYDSNGKIAITNLPAATISAAGIAQLNNSINSTSTTQAATANSVKSVVDWVKGFGIGTQIQNLTNADPNTQNATGFYSYNSAAPNTPMTGSSWYILHMDYSSTEAYQLAFKSSTNQDFYVRRKISSAWQSWTQVAQYDSTGKVAVSNLPSASTTAIGVTQLSDSTSDTSISKAATTNSVKKAYDLANSSQLSKLTKDDGTIITWNADIDTLFTSGFYYCGATARAASSNLPAAVNGAIAVYQFNSNTAFQIYHEMSASNQRMWIRYNNAGTWGAWVQLASNAVVTSSANGLMISTDKAKLDGIASGAQTNQNAFSNVVVGTSTIAADNATDTLTIAGAAPITLTPDTTNDKITIGINGATTTTAGTMSSGDKTKLDAINQTLDTASSPTFKGLTISKNGTDSIINFTAQANDPGFIKHYENNNTAHMQFSVSDDANTTDMFQFGSTSGGTFTSAMDLDTSGNAKFSGVINAFQLKCSQSGMTISADPNTGTAFSSPAGQGRYVLICDNNQYFVFDDATGASVIYSGNVRLVFHQSDAVFRMERYDGGAATLIVSSVANTSDRELKKNIEDYSGDALNEINTTPIRYYNFKEEIDGVDFPHVGIIMQEAPMDVVNAKGEGIDLYAMISLAWRSIQQLSAKNDNQQTEIDNLKKENEQLKSQMADILNRLSALENK